MPSGSCGGRGRGYDPSLFCPSPLPYKEHTINDVHKIISFSICPTPAINTSLQYYYVVHFFTTPHTIALRTVKVEVRRNAGLAFSSFLVWFCLSLASQKQVEQKNKAL